MKSKTIAEMFALYEADFIPPEASPGQVEDLKHTFFAGFCICLEWHRLLARERSPVEALAAIEAAQAEVLAFSDGTAQDRGHPRNPPTQ